MKPLKFYIESGLVRQGSKDPGEAKAMVARSSKRLEYVKSQTITEDNASFLFEDIYEVMRECIHGLMAANGYSGNSFPSLSTILKPLALNLKNRSQFQSRRKSMTCGSNMEISLQAISK